MAHKVGAGFILQMDSNCHLGKDVIENDVNQQNLNGKLFIQFLERMPNPTLINSLPLCEGSITRMRKTIRGVELSILDVFVTCERILPFISKMKVDEKREHVLTNFNSVKSAGRVIESDHNPVILEVNLEFSQIKPVRINVFQFKNKESQKELKKMTTETSEFTDCFKTDLDFEVQAKNWKKVLTKFFHKTFKKIRIRNKPKPDTSSIGKLMEKRRHLKNKQDLKEEEEEELINLEMMIAEACEESNRSKVIENFKDISGDGDNLSHQGVWRTKKKLFPKINPSLPVGRKILRNR